MCTLNIENTKDQMCFLWSVLASLHPVEQNPHRVSKYRQYENELNMDGIDYPVKLTQISKFEKQNPEISVAVYYFDNEHNLICPAYVAKYRNRNHHVNLF